MAHLIDKDAVLAEIERLKDSVPYFPTIAEKEAYKEGVDSACCKVSSLEVKEVDLDKEIDLVEDKYRGFESLSRADVIDVAKHFFEFGLNAQKGEKV